jgi:predicted MFS family arabinose efflux permease
VVILFSLTKVLPASLALLLVVGAAAIMVMNLCNSLVQTLSPDAARGRVMSIYTLSFFGFMPIGALLAGSAAERFGVPLTVAISALLMLACSAAVAVAVPGLRKQE